jgi:carboxymethylenebutenolidase
MRVYEAIPDEPRAAVIVIHEAFGLNDHIEGVARRLAGEGYHAVAPELFHRAGGGTAPYDDFSQVLPLYEGLSDEGIVVDLDATIAHLHDSGFPNRRIGIVGFCFGGRVTFLAAVERSLGAAVGFYGGGIVEARFPQFPALVDRAGGMATPWMGFFGDQDASIPPEHVERIRSSLADAPVDHQVVQYADAGHGFFCNERDGYVEHAAHDAWSRTLDWFSERLGS